MNANLTKWQKNFLSTMRSNNLPVTFWIDGSLREKRQTIRFESPADPHTQYLLTIDNRIDPNSKLDQVRQFFRTGQDIGCKVRQEQQEQQEQQPAEDFEVPF